MKGTRLFMLLSLSLMRGPLPDEGLEAIAATYGRIDRRYSSPEFCRMVFNENPFGYSYHAFVRQDDRVVGHYAVIPIRVRARGTTEVSGKGEALFIDESHRRSAIATAAGEVPTALGLMKAVHDYALMEEPVVIHNITSPEIGVLECMLGFRPLKIWLEQLHFLIRPPTFQLGFRSLRSAAIHLLSVAQRLLLWLVRTGVALIRVPVVEVNSPTQADWHLSVLASGDSEARTTWTVSRDLDTLRWFCRLGRLEIVSVRGKPEHFAIMTKGNARELLLWNVPSDAIRSGLAIACALLTGSVGDEASRVSIPRQLMPQAGASLRLILRMLAFVPQRIPLTVYVKSANDFYLRPENLNYSRTFNL